MMNINRSHFVGPTAFAGQERRRSWRRFEAIFRKGNTEPVEFLISLSMLQSAAVLFASPRFAESVLVYPRAFAVALLLLGITGFLGLSTRNSTIRGMFSFGGMFLRAWMTGLYFIHAWIDPVWCSFAVGTLALFWISVRVVCREAVRYHLTHPAKGEPKVYE